MTPLEFSHTASFFGIVKYRSLTELLSFKFSKFLSHRSKNFKFQAFFLTKYSAISCTKYISPDELFSISEFLIKCSAIHGKGVLSVL